MRHRFWLAFALIAACAAERPRKATPPAPSQVMSPIRMALAVPGATVSASSPALQGVRTAVTSANGDYIIPFLPAGDYEVAFELQGFRTVTRKVSVNMAATQTLDVTLAVAQLAETITVTGQASEIVADGDDRGELQERSARAAAGRPRTERRRAARAGGGRQRPERQHHDLGRACRSRASIWSTASSSTRTCAARRSTSSSKTRFRRRRSRPARSRRSTAASAAAWST